MVGFELAPQPGSGSTFLRVAWEQELLGYVVAGYLLHRHGMRVAPTLSSPNTLRIQPSALISVAELDRLCGALEEVVAALRAGDGGKLVAHLAEHHAPSSHVRQGIPPIQHYLPRAERLEMAGSASPIVHHERPRRGPAAHKRVVFLAHFLEPGDLRAWDPSLAAFDDGACARMLDRIRGLIEPFVSQRSSVRSASGDEVAVTVIGVPFSAQQVMASFKGKDGAWIRDMLEQAVELARAEGGDVIGFGGYTSILTNNCLDVLEDRALLTSGNSLTAAAAVEATLAAVARLGLPQIRLGVVGAVGNIGSVLAEVFADRVDTIVLVGKPAARRRLEARAEELRGRTSGEVTIEIATDMSALRGCNVVVSATNSPQHVIHAEHLGDGPVVVCDIATPGDVSPDVALARPRAILLKGGIMRLPLGQHLRVDGMQLPRGHVYGCLAETLLMGLAGLDESLSFGTLDAAQIRRAGELARAHGFDVALRPLFKPVTSSPPTELACSSA
jgi:predicted amino acid dehydrogenase